MSLHGWILRSLATRPFREAVVDDFRRWRAVELLAGAAHVAGALSRRSASPTVGVMLPTSGLFPVAALGAWWAGKVVVPVNYLLKEAEMQYIVAHSGVDVVVTVGPMLEHAPTPRGAQLLRLDELDLQQPPEPLPVARKSSREVAALLYTSGTSGRPKGVMLTHGNLTANIRQCQEHVEFTRRDSLLGVLPQFHSFGFTVLTMLPLALQLRVVFATRFQPARIVELIQRERPTVFVAIPSMYNALLAVKKASAKDLASLRLCVSGGEPLPRDVAERFERRFSCVISEGYGLTETAPVTNLCRPSDQAPGSVGPPLPCVQERIADPETGRTLPANEEGEVRIKGPNVMRGYFHREQETREAFDERGFFRTGDMGRFDERGNLYITGRIKEMLIIGGENVFPREIEEVLNRHPAVVASGVVGMADAMRGEVPVAFVELGAETTEAELRAWCKERLAGYKVPREIIVVDELPRSPTGKILRRALQEALPQRLAQRQRERRVEHCPGEDSNLHPV
ncbi:MAG: long-chain fatty acid--CoA ligase [Planctomycetota bacterium]|nr:MAG: long-chain fatty acid--CoA ligase [Planctomycetota bacterium]